MDVQVNEPTDPRRSVRVVIRGRVQGVGFRYATVREAESVGLAGWVRNREDGGVEAVFAGPRGDVDRMIEWCRRGPRAARVDDLRVAEEPEASPPLAGFHVRF
jgi:acylphosphatase